ncbi:hypothetical protein EYF80_034276 [Liparis tanakae]|uniref:Uncharacterized protein n=1 Tax=Liparis tanakae TaxID=230148 RepID=A0A4Z2GSE1_9TELE|nr:hypothetical protein EYF80_034276 [Liparis tanakae]
MQALVSASPLLSVGVASSSPMFPLPYPQTVWNNIGKRVSTDRAVRCQHGSPWAIEPPGRELLSHLSGALVLTCPLGFDYVQEGKFS